MHFPLPIKAASLLLVLASALVTPARGADVLYDNSSTGGIDAYYSGLEYGDEIILVGSAKVVNEFLFEYYGEFTPTGAETARIRLYLNDGPGVDPTPGTVIYDSGPVSISPGYQTKSLTGLSIPITKTDITWTIQFSGLPNATGARAGLLFRDPPTVGSSFDDFWLKTPTGWRLLGWEGNPIANFAARVVGVTQSSTQQPTVAIRSEPNKVILEWTGAFSLRSATAVAGPYTETPSTQNKVEFDTRTAPAQFWQLHQ